MTVLIGLECHVQLNTKSKLFCGCSLEYSKPNSSVCDVCLGMPGSKPVLNEKALELALRVATTLKCKIANETLFSRKSYFYPDMPKNYQISQFEMPLAYNGKIDNIRITRVQLEEDPGSLIHKDNYTLIDYNRAGTPLIEVVTEPDFKNPEETRLFLNKFTTMLEYLQVYNRKSEFSLRVDANVSINNGERVEIKNVYGIKDVFKALNYEITRQNREKVVRETRGWDSINKKTVSLRLKEIEEDYGYILDPDLPKVIIDKNFIKKIIDNLPELADVKADRFIRTFKIDPTDAKIITQDFLIGNLYEQVVKEKANPVLAARWFRRELLRVLNYNNKSLHETPIKKEHLLDLFSILEKKLITDNTAQRILEILVNNDINIKDYIKTHGLEVIRDNNKIEDICKDVIKANKKVVEDYLSGKLAAFHYLTGQVMKETKGKADPILVKKILQKLIQDSKAIN